MNSAFARSVLVAAAVALLASHVLARPDSQAVQSGMGREDSGAPPLDRSKPTPLQQFASRLKLDQKDQIPAVERIFSAAAEEAAPVAQQMLQLRQQLVNLMLADKPEDTKAVVDAYTAAAARMAGIEAQAFAKVYAMLRPNQQAGASDAFAVIAGMFHPSAPRGGRRGE